jgi:outer membrane protein OmpA-like peptidoglycan-associated protein
MKKLIILSILFFTIVSFSQSKRKANKYFNQFSYVKSAELFEKIVQKGDSSKTVLSKLADSYFYNSITEKSELYYKKLFSLYEKDNLKAIYYFRLSQSLKSNGKYKESDEWLLKFKTISKHDSRGNKIKENSNYLTDFTNQEDLYITVHNVSINTSYSDYGTFKIGNDIYFASTKPERTITGSKLYSWNKQPFYNIYKATDSIITDKKGLKKVDITSSIKLKDINTAYHDASSVITKDGKTMYFTRDNFDGKKLKGDKKRTSHLKIYKATLDTTNNWTNTEELPFNSDEYSVGHPALNPNETVLYFTSDMPGGYGEGDIYKVEILEDNTFGKPKNLEGIINTEGKEMFPFVSAKNELFFASDGHLGLGLLDIFKATIHGDNYKELKNIGAPINSNKDDFSFFIDASDKKGYFSSNREGGKGDDDMYSFVYYDCKQSITGTTYSLTSNSILQAVEVNLINLEGTVLKSTISDEDGMYTFKNIDCNQQVTLAGSLRDYKSDTTVLDLGKKEQQEVLSKLFLKQVILNNEIIVPVLFDLNKSNIRSDAGYELDNVVKVMRQHPKIVIKIESHTDYRGSKKYNRKLSNKRAKNSRDYIISKGINASRIESAIGYGEDKLFNNCDDTNGENCSEKEHAANRRSYFYIIDGREIK